MAENKKQEEIKRFFKVDDNFIEKLDAILKEHWVLEKHRKEIAREFVELIKRSIVK